MNLKKALKEKNKLKGKINNLAIKLYQYNLVEEGQTAAYDTHLIYEELLVLTNQMIELKTKIHIANAPVFHKIFRLSELKSIAKQIHHIKCDKKRDSNGSTFIFSHPTITNTERDKLIEDIENEIEKIQDELDSFNHQTNI